MIAYFLLSQSKSYTKDRITSNQINQLIALIYETTKISLASSNTNQVKILNIIDKMKKGEYPIFIRLINKNTTNLLLIDSTNQGYNGEIVVMFHVQDKEFKSIRVIKHQETPGIGDAIVLNEAWLNDITTNNYDTITGATVSTKAVNLLAENIINKLALSQYSNLKPINLLATN